jgi:hypothetical protein
MTKKFSRMMAAVVFAGMAGSAAAEVDQSNPWDSTGQLNSQEPSLIWQQTVVTGKTGILSSVELYTASLPGSFEFFINRGTGWQSDANDFSVNLSPASYSMISVNLSAANLSFVAGESYVIGIRGLGPTGNCCGVGFTTENKYAAGQLYLNGQNFDPEYDLAFRTNVNAVPEPETYAMLLAGLGLFGYMRRRQQQG